MSTIHSCLNTMDLEVAKHTLAIELLSSTPLTPNDEIKINGDLHTRKLVWVPDALASELGEEHNCTLARITLGRDFSSTVTYHFPPACKHFKELATSTGVRLDLPNVRAIVTRCALM